jgi:hypothetical protein
MKLLKIFGLLALVALMAMAFVGAGSAMANGSTALCVDMPTSHDDFLTGDKDGVCNDTISHVHKGTLTGAKAKVLSSALNVECDSLLLADVLGLGNPQVLHNVKLTYTNCNSGCVVTQEGTGLATVLRLSHETADFNLSIQLHEECGAFIDCKYSGEGLLGTTIGPLLSSHENGELTISEQVMNKVGGAFCPSTAKLDITTTPLTRTYLGL